MGVRNTSHWVGFQHGFQSSIVTQLVVLSLATKYRNIPFSVIKAGTIQAERGYCPTHQVFTITLSK